MLERFGITDRDRRNLVVVAVVIGVMMAILTEGTAFTRAVAFVVGGLLSGVVFVITTVLIKKAGLEY